MTEPGTEPIALVVQGKDVLSAFACGKCHVVASSPRQFGGTEEEIVEAARKAARTHCGPWFCTCGVECRQYRTTCDACWKIAADKRDAEREAAHVAKAKRVHFKEYDGQMLFDERRDRYLDPDEVADMALDDDLPEHMWGCTVTGLKLDAGDIIDGALESGEHHEDAADWLAQDAAKALQTALDRWVKKYAKGVRTFFPDYSVMVTFEEEATDDSSKDKET